jgi:hypothetical protein
VTNGTPPDPIATVEALAKITGLYDTLKRDFLARGWSETGAEQAAIAAMNVAQVVGRRPQ